MDVPLPDPPCIWSTMAAPGSHPYSTAQLRLVRVTAWLLWSVRPACDRQALLNPLKVYELLPNIDTPQIDLL